MDTLTHAQFWNQACYWSDRWAIETTAALNGVRFVTDLSKINAHRGSLTWRSALQQLWPTGQNPSDVQQPGHCICGDHGEQLSFYKASKLLSHCVEEHIHLLAPHPCTCLSFMVELQVLEPSWREARCLRACESQLKRIHAKHLFLQLNHFTWGPGLTQKPTINSKTSVENDPQLVRPQNIHTPFWTHSSASGGWKKNDPFLMSHPRPAKHLETSFTPDK